MSSLIVPVTIIEKITPHPNADALELAQYLDWHVFVETCQRFGVETVPVVATIPFDLAEVKRYSEGKTLLLTEDAHIREGLVVRPVTERSDPKIGRVILKYLSDSYLFGEKTDYTDR